MPGLEPMLTHHCDDAAPNVVNAARLAADAQRHMAHLHACARARGLWSQVGWTDLRGASCASLDGEALGNWHLGHPHVKWTAATCGGMQQHEHPVDGERMALHSFALSIRLLARRQTNGSWARHTARCAACRGPALPAHLHHEQWHAAKRGAEVPDEAEVRQQAKPAIRATGAGEFTCATCTCVGAHRDGPRVTLRAASCTAPPPPLPSSDNHCHRISG